MEQQDIRNSGALDDIFLYFMRTSLRAQTSGIERLPVENPLNGVWRDYLDRAMAIILNADPPEVARLLLDAERNTALRQTEPDMVTALGLGLMEELSWQLWYGQPFAYLLSTGNLWGRRAEEYATLTLYPNLPPEVQAAQSIDRLLAGLPREMLRPEDF